MKRLLIIEDDQALAAILSRRMARHGFECQQSYDASDALLTARHFQPSHILLDMKLAKDNGLNLIVPLRNLLPQTMMVLLTGYASIATAVEAMRLGANNYLAKPVDTHTLLTALEAGDNQSSLNEDNQEDTLDDLPLSPKRLEWEHIQQVLNANQGNVSETARQLGMHRRTLQRKLLKKPVFS
ncbi:response regulator transcription factor [Shewanella sp. SR44-3]|uniref:response regulator transcription factor n=1 Tax=unclassified Shewanella TaxID=196818 RepID=UPI0015FBF626|nr:response regulator [Shewanella sp. SR44-3]MBB1270964.1 response regulator [Shewanella sp. SR44-3]